MRTLTIRDLRLHWPAAEKALEQEEEIVITRDGRPVAKLVKFPETSPVRTRFEAKKHLAHVRKVLKGKVLPNGDLRLAESRVDRFAR
jgi:antitoxin (DNA-binding transcriptional repressor) of toxin-antitoxin stability system